MTIKIDSYGMVYPTNPVCIDGINVQNISCVINSAGHLVASITFKNGSIANNFFEFWVQDTINPTLTSLSTAMSSSGGDSFPISVTDSAGNAMSWFQSGNGGVPLTCARGEGAYSRVSTSTGGYNAWFNFTTLTPYLANPVFELNYPTEIAFSNPVSICNVIVGTATYPYTCRVEKNGNRVQIYDGTMPAISAGTAVSLVVGPVTTIPTGFNIYKGLNFETILAMTSESSSSSSGGNGMGIIAACDFFDLLNFNTF